MGAKITDKYMFTGVVAHPIRARALTILADREASPVEIARELDMGASHIAYHVRILHKEGLIELTEETPRRGSIEHRFRAVFPPELSDEEYAALSMEERSKFSRLIFSFAAADACCAFSAGSFADRPDHHISRMPLQVDDDGWKELRDLYENTLREVYRIKRESGDRLTEGGMRGTSVLAFSTFFELPSNRVIPRNFNWLSPS
ncbi:MAG TPA: winged helix-turn-helix domain-containing protein [Solirubrobacterales bacterium]